MVPEPISITVAVVSLLKATYSVASTLTAITRDVQKAPKAAQNALAETRAISSILRQLQSYVDGAVTASNSRNALINLEEIVATVTDCVCAYSELESILNALKTDEMGGWDRVKWMWNNDRIVKITTRIQTQKASLSLMFNVLTCKLQQEAVESSSRLVELVERLYTENLELSKRVKKLEYTTSIAETVYKRSVDDVSAIFPGRQEEITNYDTDAGLLNIDLESTQHSIVWQEVETSLQSSRPYRRAANRHIRSSVTQEDDTVGHSILSDLSLSDISNLSVIALPLSIDEILYVQHHFAAATSNQLSTSTRRESLDQTKIMNNASVKALLVGDDSPLIRRFIATYLKSEYSDDYLPFYSATTIVEVMIDNQALTLNIDNVADLMKYDRLRPLSYPGTDVCLICLPLWDTKRFANALRNAHENWMPEIKYFCPLAPILLVGVMPGSDIVKDVNDPSPFVPESVGGDDILMVESIFGLLGAQSYLKCDLPSTRGVKHVMNEAIIAAINARPRKNRPSHWLRARLRALTEAQADQKS